MAKHSILCPQCKDTLGDVVEHFIQCTSVDLERMYRVGIIDAGEANYIEAWRDNTLFVKRGI